MKLFLVVVIFIMFLIASCGKAPLPAPQPQPAPQPVIAPDPPQQDPLADYRDLQDGDATFKAIEETLEVIS